MTLWKVFREHIAHVLDQPIHRAARNIDVHMIAVLLHTREVIDLAIEHHLCALPNTSKPQSSFWGKFMKNVTELRNLRICPQLSQLILQNVAFPKEYKHKLRSNRLNTSWRNSRTPQSPNNRKVV